MQRYRDIFVFVAGMTPQIITETIYALLKKKPRIYPHEIHIITTLTGKNIIKKTLISDGILVEMSREFGMPPIPVAEDTFVVPKDENGNEIIDIRNEEENERMGDAITSLIREKTGDESTRLHCSIAGGRKTMSFYLGAALQLFGRSQDRLYHVLVTPEFESNPQFFFKPRKNMVIEVKSPDGKIKRLETKDAVVSIAELPYIRLRDQLSLRGLSFKELVDEGQREIDIAAIQPEISINLAERTVNIGRTLIEMVPVQLMVFTAFLKLKTVHCKHLDRPYCFDCTDCYQVLSHFVDPSVVEELALDYKKIYRDNLFKYQEFIEKWKGNIGTEVLRQHISKINRTIRGQIDKETLLPYFTISNIKQYGSSRYGVRVEKNKIRIQ